MLLRPAQTSADLIAELQRYVVVDPHPFVVDLARCHDSYLVTIEGESILDFGGYYGSKLVAHNHPGLSDADYVRRLVIAANNKVPNPDFLTVECLDYYRLLIRIAPRCMRDSPTLEAYAVNSGAEAVENMMKYLINMHDEKLSRQATEVGVRRFIYFSNAFHGRTIAALNVTQITHDPLITQDFRGLVAGNIEAPFPSIDSDAPPAENARRVDESIAFIEACLKRYGSEIVGIIVEPIQGAGGHNVASAEFFRRLSTIAHDHGVYIGFDEVQTAGGQLGEVFAIDQFDLPHPPQAVAVGKKFANGVVYMLETMTDCGILDSTWGGSLADMVRFCREWQIVTDEPLIEKVPAKAAQMVAGLSHLQARFPQLLHNIRGGGLYQGFSVRGAGNVSRLIDFALTDQHLFLLPAGPGSIRLRPSLSVTEGEIDLLLESLNRCFEYLNATQDIAA